MQTPLKGPTMRDAPPSYDEIAFLNNEFKNIDMDSKNDNVISGKYSADNQVKVFALQQSSPSSEVHQCCKTLSCV